MAYTLIIGEKTTGSNEYESWVTAEVVRRSDAPAYGEVTGHTNQRFVSGSTYRHSMEVLGLTDLMYGMAMTTALSFGASSGIKG